MPSWSERDLRTQYNRARSSGWLPYFDEAAATYDLDEADLMAIASRETNMRNIKGDYRNGRWNGFSLMQLDVGSHKTWIESGAWQDVRGAILKGAKAYLDKRNRIKSQVGQTFTIKKGSQAFTAVGKPHTRAQLRMIGFAAYNSGDWANYHFSKGRHQDSSTTGKDYSEDTSKRAAVFRKFLGADGLYDRMEGEDLATVAGIPLIVDEPDPPPPTVAHNTELDEPAPPAAPVAPAEVTIQGNENVTVAAPGATAPVPGGGPADPPKSITGRVYARITALVAMITGGTVADTVVNKAAENPEMAKNLLTPGFFIALAVIFGAVIIGFVVYEMVTNHQVIQATSDPNRMNVK